MADVTEQEKVEEVVESEESVFEEDSFTIEDEQLVALEKKIIELENEVADLKDRNLRKQADFENFRKRMFREKEDAIRYANSNLIADLVSVIDDLERAIVSAEQTQNFESLLSGIQLIEKQFLSMLENNWGLKRMETLGKEFNPQEHEALMKTEDSEYKIETVVEDYQKGYYLHDRVLRHAKVRVGTPKSSEPASKSE